MHTSATCITSLKLLGDYWSLRIIDALGNTSLRYCQLQRALDNLNPVTLANRLKRLEEAGMILRSHDAADKIAVSYELTARGKQALPVIAEINRFAKQNSAAILSGE
ncbi:helix-turn-helix transcriptional regulator [bacterium]|nr:MAG: helix-turn-helix transcriptional regulator [bacterium]